jgi:hypothetical protein
MDVSLDVRRFLKNRRDRAVGSILGYAEAELRPNLTDAQWQQFRQVVLDAANSYHDTVLDIVKSDQSVRNDHLIALLESVDQKLGQKNGARAAASGN